MMDKARFNAREFAKTMSNADKVVFSEMQKNFFRKESSYFGSSVDMNFPGGGGPKLEAKRSFDSPAKSAVYESQVVDPSSCGDLCELTTTLASAENGAAEAGKLRKTSKVVQIKGVGFDLVYTRDGDASAKCEPSSVQQYNVETPCKIIMAVVLIAYVMNQNCESRTELQSFVGAILETCRTVFWDSGANDGDTAKSPVLKPRWFSSPENANTKECDLGKGGDSSVKAVKNGDFWKPDFWSKKLVDTFGRGGLVPFGGSASPCDKITANTQSVNWVDKVTSLFNRIRV